MKSIYILAGIMALGIINANAQDYTPSSSGATITEASVQGNTPSATEDTTTMAKLETDAGEVTTIFNTPVESTKSGGCSLIQNAHRDKKITYKKNGYTMVTENKDEYIDVKNKSNGDKKLTYYNDFETLDYHKKYDGKTHYKYSYYNECKKVKVRKNKKGIISVTNRAGGDLKEVQTNVNAAIKKGANTCAGTKYSR
jgi:hypothetical protein